MELPVDGLHALEGHGSETRRQVQIKAGRLRGLGEDLEWVIIATLQHNRK